MMEHRLAGYQFIPYKIKLTAPWLSAKGSFNYRQGIVLKLQTETGLGGTGECAPLPSMGSETLQTAQTQLKNNLPGLIGLPLSRIYDTLETAFPASNFALESALLDLEAKQHNTSIARLINARAATEITVNTMLGYLQSNILLKAKQAENLGFRVLKVKMGLGSVAEELDRLKLLIEQLHPRTQLRLDANQAWDVEQCLRVLHMLHQYPGKIDSLEEPLKHFNEQLYRELQQSTSISLALDESFSTADPFSNEHATEKFTLPVKRLILKPQLIGSLLKCYQIATLARKQKIEVVISSSIETGYGLWACTYLAAALNNHQTHGLATGHWLEETLIPVPAISNGTIQLDL